jgi:hypothetical protein
MSGNPNIRKFWCLLIRPRVTSEISQNEISYFAKFGWNSAEFWSRKSQISQNWSPVPVLPSQRSMLTVYSPLSIAHCLMSTVFCLPTVYFSLFIARCPLFTAYPLLHTVYCLLSTARCLLPTAHCPLIFGGLATIFARLEFAGLLYLLRFAGKSSGHASLKSGHSISVLRRGMWLASVGTDKTWEPLHWKNIILVHDWLPHPMYTVYIYIHTKTKKRIAQLCTIRQSELSVAKGIVNMRNTRFW